MVDQRSIGIKRGVLGTAEGFRALGIGVDLLAEVEHGVLRRVCMRRGREESGTIANVR